ncbi:hypothetical protein [Paenibacillus glucanolyticus]|uniref:hypothetical protein n=1 Tax=Paenibacillus glucanolyticus TaxID=59843 RepID=UPI00096D8592|nr:hypothetical protein [Paenibacillus glucanolyticus]OMF76705.1 hypothetical protein BK142_14385 [Paenibacillus glucanolyticus]
MNTRTIKKLKNESTRQRRHLNYRKVSLPRLRNFDRHVQHPFTDQFKKGIFKNDIYFTMKPSFIAWVYIKNIILFNIPAFAIHSILLFLSFMNHIVLNESSSLTTTAGGLQLLTLAYGICTILAFRRINDHMAYYNNTMLLSKYDINQSLVTMIWRTIEPSENKEIEVMDHYRLKFIKQNLFPTIKELALEEQLYSRNIKSKHVAVRQGAEMRYNRFSLDNRREEHIAAKHLADWKQDEYGGANEYDMLIKKYSHRAAPVIRDMIKDLQNDMV